MFNAAGTRGRFATLKQVGALSTMRLPARSQSQVMGQVVDQPWLVDAATLGMPTLTDVEVAIFITRADQSEVLVTHRVRELGDHWHVIAGGVQEGETPSQAAERELLEEAGLRAAFSCEDDVHAFAYAVVGSSVPLEGGRRTPVTKMKVICFLVEASSTWEPILNWEHDAYAWVSLREACERLHWPSMGRALRQALLSPRPAR